MTDDALDYYMTLAREDYREENKKNYKGGLEVMSSEVKRLRAELESVKCDLAHTRLDHDAALKLVEMREAELEQAKRERDEAKGKRCE